MYFGRFHRTNYEDVDSTNLSFGGVWRNVCQNSKGKGIDMEVTVSEPDPLLLLGGSFGLRGGGYVLMNLRHHYTSPPVSLRFFKTGTKIPVKVKSVSMVWEFWQVGNAPPPNVFYFDTPPDAWSTPKSTKFGGKEAKQGTYLHVSMDKGRL